MRRRLIIQFIVITLLAWLVWLLINSKRDAVDGQVQTLIAVELRFSDTIGVGLTTAR